METDLAGKLVAGLPLPVLLIGPDDRVRAANAAAEALFGAGLSGRPYFAVIRQPALVEGLEAALRGREAKRVRVVLSGQGRDAAHRVSFAPLALGDGTGALLSFEDLSDLERAEAMRRDFVANVSHELRTPLTALLGFIETLKGAARDDAAARARFLEIMEREAGRMNRLVSDLLSLSRVEAGERLRPGRMVDVAALLRASLAALRPMAEAAGVALEASGEPGPLKAPGDGDQLTQVFHNLIENAVKYGGAGGVVRVDLTRVAHEPALRGPAVRIAVIDRGEGIEALHLPRLTERFYRVDNHRSREQGGTGLGLAIVKHIVNRHRGRLRIESERGKGSEFIVLLPES